MFISSVITISSSSLLLASEELVVSEVSSASFDCQVSLASLVSKLFFVSEGTEDEVLEELSIEVSPLDDVEFSVSAVSVEITSSALSLLDASIAYTIDELGTNAVNISIVITDILFILFIIYLTLLFAYCLQLILI